MGNSRLPSALGVEGAVHMVRKLLLHSLEQAFVKGFTVELCVSLAPTDPCWNRLSLPAIHTVMSAWIC